MVVIHRSVVCSIWFSKPILRCSESLQEAISLPLSLGTKIRNSTLCGVGWGHWGEIEGWWESHSSAGI